MKLSKINIEVALDEHKMPESISWTAPEGGMEQTQKAKSLLLGFWDEQENSALRIDLWTKNMRIDEMNDFFFQSFIGMADTFTRATNHPELANEIKTFAKSFHKKVVDTLNKEAQ